MFTREAALAMATIYHVELPDGWIAVDYSKFETETELARVIAHEIGHIMTGTFYKADDPAAVKADCERQADEWAATHLIDYVRS